MQSLSTYQLPLTPTLSSLAYEIEAARNTYTRFSLPKFRQQLETTFANRNFFAVDHVECLAMQAFLVQLQMRTTLGSVIWLHDAVWIPREVPINDIRFAERVMLQSLNLCSDDEPFCRVSQLDCPKSPKVLN